MKVLSVSQKIFVLGGHFPKCIFAEGRRLDTTPSFWKSWKCRKSCISKILPFCQTKWPRHGVQKDAKCVSGHFCPVNSPSCHMEHFYFICWDSFCSMFSNLFFDLIGSPIGAATRSRGAGTTSSSVRSRSCGVGTGAGADGVNINKLSWWVNLMAFWRLFDGLLVVLYGFWWFGNARSL